MFKNKDGSYNKIQIIIISLIFIIGLMITGIYIFENIELPKINTPNISTIIPTTQTTSIQTPIQIYSNTSVDNATYNWSVDFWVNGSTNATYTYYQNWSNTTVDSNISYNSPDWIYLIATGRISENDTYWNWTSTNTSENSIPRINDSINQSVMLFTSQYNSWFSFIWVLLSILLVALLSLRGYSVLVPLSCISMIGIFMFNVNAALLIPGLFMATLFFYLNR